MFCIINLPRLAGHSIRIISVLAYDINVCYRIIVVQLYNVVHGVQAHRGQGKDSAAPSALEKWEVTLLQSQDDSWEQKQRDSELDIYRTLDTECKKWEVRDA